MKLGLDTLTSEHQIPQRGREDHFAALKGTVLGNYFYVHHKAWGIEPGFIGVHINGDFFNFVQDYVKNKDGLVKLTGTPPIKLNNMHEARGNMQKWFHQNPALAKELADHIFKEKN